ncbi:F-box/WD repeat-containing protein 7-like [Carcharodon carcharias]|uniref:F-box/WD repeat-containing protein 7-like n=1 Tax=Carcharodon carcharias TaxID=13397 RepID=UPI001B7F3B2C|nr:F-box/WD repeat-containing protein 7-like [Carcharodon carcharias]
MSSSPARYPLGKVLKLTGTPTPPFRSHSRFSAGGGGESRSRCELHFIWSQSVSHPPARVAATCTPSANLVKVQEVASWLLEMNQELLSGGSKRRRTGGSLRGNASVSHREEEQMNRVVEEQEGHCVRNADGSGPEASSSTSDEAQVATAEEENNNQITVAAEEENKEEEQEDGEEEMDQDSDDFEQSDSSREDDSTNGNDVTDQNYNIDVAIQQPLALLTKNQL